MAGAEVSHKGNVEIGRPPGGMPNEVRLSLEYTGRRHLDLSPNGGLDLSGRHGRTLRRAAEPRKRTIRSLAHPGWGRRHDLHIVTGPRGCVDRRRPQAG
jgi:hypothetical protein